jgi:hypothetical protein
LTTLLKRRDIGPTLRAKIFWGSEGSPNLDPFPWGIFVSRDFRKFKEVILGFPYLGTHGTQAGMSYFTVHV